MDTFEQWVFGLREKMHKIEKQNIISYELSRIV